MKKLLFVFFVLAVVLGSNSLYAQHVSMVSNDDERERFLCFRQVQKRVVL